MMKFREKDPLTLIKNGNKKKSRQKTGCRAYFNTPFDPRVPHPRKLISKTYGILARSYKASNLFPRENLVASSRRQKNLSEMLSPTIQGPRPGMGGGDGPAPGMDDQSAQRGRGRGRGRGQRGRGGRGGVGSQGGDDSSTRQDETALPSDSSSSSSSRPMIINGSYHCVYHKKSGKCDVCKPMEEEKNVLSSHFIIPHSIAGHNTHLPATQKPKLKWFIYLEECIHPEGIYQFVGSTDSMTHRWATTPSPR